MDNFLNLVVVVYLAGAMTMDLKKRCVKNWWIITGYVMSVVVSYFDKKGISSFFLGFIFPIPLLVFYHLKMIGAGDIKLLSVTGCFLGIGKMIQSIIPIVSIALLMSFLLLISNYYRKSKKYENKIPLVVAILSGVIVTIYGG